MKEESILEIIITFAANMDEKTFSEWNLLILEIVFLLFKGRDPENLVKGYEKAVRLCLLQICESPSVHHGNAN